MVNPNALRMCCLGCGRETRARTGFCSACSVPPEPPERQCPAIPVSDYLDDPDDFPDDSPPSADETYHGPDIPDDI